MIYWMVHFSDFQMEKKENVMYLDIFMIIVNGVWLQFFENMRNIQIDIDRHVTSVFVDIKGITNSLSFFQHYTLYWFYYLTIAVYLSGQNQS